jgi:hypothetical protein
MSFTASVSSIVRADPAEAFRRFIDFTAWREFMPESFRPIRGPARALASGDRLRMRLDTGLAKIPVPVEVFQVEAPRISWGGGSALLHANHRFVFEDPGDGTTLIRSDEDWTGLLTRVPAVESRLRRQAERIARAQLDGFARWITRP